MIKYWNVETTIQTPAWEQPLPELYSFKDLKQIIKARNWGRLTYQMRMDWVHQIGWTWFCKEYLSHLLELDPNREYKWIDIGAGTGYVGAHLRAHGISIECYENYTHLHDDLVSPNYGVTHVDDAVDKITSDHKMVILNWPPYEHDLAERVVNKMGSGQILIYSGEMRGGCTGNDEFFDILDMSFKDITPDFMEDNWLVPAGISDQWKIYIKVDIKLLS